LRAKDEYLDFLKKSLLELARRKNQQAGADQQASAEFLDALEKEVENGDLATFEVAKRLNLFNFEQEPDDPLRILAGLPIPVYLTTSYHDFMEAALVASGRKPRSEICYWREDLEFDIPSVLDDDSDYSPSEEEPLVFHLLGREVLPASMVLSEDDFFDFLVRVSQDSELLPPRINQALADSVLLLLGFRPEGWDFRVLLRGIIKTKPVGRRPKSISIQLPPSVEDDKKRLPNLRSYLEEFFKGNKFDIYWGDVASFAKELRDHWD